jgi:hypothetical protein
MDFLEILCDPYHANTGETADAPESMKSFRKLFKIIRQGSEKEGVVALWRQ